MSDAIQNSYTADSIKILSDLDHIRQNPGMYIGDTHSALGPAHLFTECIDNAIDEVANHGSKGFTVHVITADDKITYVVQDFGFGIPAGYKEVGEKQIAILELLLTKSNSGGKFDSKAYLSSAGLHGLGLKAINALADEVEVTSINNGTKGYVHMVKGEAVEPTVYTETKEKSGTTFSFTIYKDNPYFDDYKIPMSFITQRLNMYQAFGVENVHLYKDDKEIELTAHSLADLYPHTDKLKNPDNYKPAIMGDIEVQNYKGEKLRVYFEYTGSSATSYSFHGFVNYITCNQGGHITAVQKAICLALTDFCEVRQDVKTPSDYINDYFIGLNAICSCNIIEKAFSSQTKEKLITGSGNSYGYFNELMYKLATKIKTEVFEKNVGMTKALIKRIAEYRKRLNSQSELRGLSQYIKVNDNTDGYGIRRGSVYEKLIECTSKNPGECELIICEGDSAAGGMRRTRDKETQAILPLRGKFKNVVGISPKDALKNKEVAGIVSSVGTDIFERCDVSRLRYEDVFYAGDADSDGYHITNLVTAFFVNYLAEIVKAGRFHLILTPLYIWWSKTEGWLGAMTFDEVPNEIKDSHRYTRVKGLGEMNDDQVHEFLLNPKKRFVMTVEYPSDLDEFNYIMSTSAGKRELILESGLLTE